MPLSLSKKRVASVFTHFFAVLPKRAFPGDRIGGARESAAAPPRGKKPEQHTQIYMCVCPHTITITLMLFHQT